MTTLAFLPPRFPRFFAAVYRSVETLLRRIAPRIHGTRLERPFTALERGVKKLLFDCRMCGDCLLLQTGMVCPMRCPKELRNGPCGGVRADGHCEIEPARRCVWVDAWRGLRVMDQPARFAAVNAGRRHDRRGRSAWLQAAQPPVLAGPPPGPPPGPAPEGPASRLEECLAAGAFAVTAEMTPPDSADPQDFREQLVHYRGYVDAINVPDGPGAHCHMSSLAAAALLLGAGLQPVMQLCCRDRNVIALQADILGAAALGVRNLLCLTGDGIANGDHGWAQPVFELDSTTLIGTAVMIGARGQLLSGRRLAAAPPLFVGATVNPFSEPLDARALNLARKVAAGARFVQTQYCFDIAHFSAFMQQVRDLGLHERCHILVGLGLLPSARAARWICQHVPGTHIPAALIARLERSAHPEKTGLEICLELIEQVRAIPGVSGVHLMMHRHRHLLAELVTRSGLGAARHTTAVASDAPPASRPVGVDPLRPLCCPD